MSATTSPRPTALVTACENPLGYDTARQLAADGYHVIVHAHSKDAGEIAIERLVKDGADPLVLELAVADFDELDQVADLARYVIARHHILQILANTSVTAPTGQRLVTHDGVERTFQRNYLAPYLLTRLLAELLLGNGRIVSVASTLHRGANISWTDLNRTHRYSPLAAFGQSALATVMFTAMAADLWGSLSTAIAVDPGTCDVGVLRLHGPTKQAHTAAGLVVAELCAADLPLLDGSFYDGAWPCPSIHVSTARARERLWVRSAELVGLR